MRFSRSIWILLAIVILGAVLRLYNLDKVPMYGDELTIVLDSYSLLKNGTDQLGNPWPVTFEMGAGRPAGYVYGSIPFVALFGPTYLGVRMLSILSGLGLIFLAYLLAKRFTSEKVGLYAAFLTAISPWGINLSRGGFEANFALFLLLLGTVLVVYLRKQWYLILASLCFGLVIHTYPTYKLTLPLFATLLIWFTGTGRSLLSKKQILVSGLGVLILIGAVLLSAQQTLVNNSEGRFNEINIFSSKESSEAITQKINSERTISQLPEVLKPLFINKYLGYSVMYADNYFKNLSFDFLFLHGDGNPRHNMSVSGGFYLVEIIFILAGFVSLVIKNKRLVIFLIAWILITPLATALISTPHFLRSAMMLPPLIILSAVGLSNLRPMIRWVLLGALVIQLIILSSRLYFLAPSDFGRFWSEPAKIATEYIEKHKSDYDYVIVSDRIDSIEYGYPVYTKVDPIKVIENNQKGDKSYGNVRLSSLPSAHVDRFMKDLKTKAVYIGPAEDGELIEGESVLHRKDSKASLVVKSYGR